MSAKHIPSSEEAIRLQAIFQHAIDGIIIINHCGNIEKVNPAAATLFGYEEEELIGKNISTLMPMPHRAAHDDYINRYQKTREARIIGIGRQVEGLRKNGETFPFNLGVSEVILEDRVLYTGFIHDLSAQKAAEAKMIELNQSLESMVEERTNELTKTVNRLLRVKRELEREVNERQRVEDALRASEFELKEALAKARELNELKTRFVSMASHEFRTPLSTIQSSAALAGRYTTAEQQDKRIKHLERIKSSVQHMTSILNDFLSIGKLEEGHIGMELEKVNILEAAEIIIEDMQGMIKEGQEIQLGNSLEEVFIEIDKKMVRNIIMNLLSNAIKYSDEGNSIELHLDRDDSYLCIQVRDYGIGIPEEDQHHLFTRFFRATNAMNIKGTGLGLNIVKSYLDLLGGHIEFQSKQGEGSIFSVYLPMRNNTSST